MMMQADQKVLRSVSCFYFFFETAEKVLIFYIFFFFLKKISLVIKSLSLTNKTFDEAPEDALEVPGSFLIVFKK